MSVFIIAYIVRFFYIEIDINTFNYAIYATCMKLYNV